MVIFLRNTFFTKLGFPDISFLLSFYLLSLCSLNTANSLIFHWTLNSSPSQYYVPKIVRFSWVRTYSKQNKVLMKRNFNTFCKQRFPLFNIFPSLYNAYNTSSVSDLYYTKVIKCIISYTKRHHINCIKKP